MVRESDNNGEHLSSRGTPSGIFLGRHISFDISKILVSEINMFVITPLSFCKKSELFPKSVDYLKWPGKLPIKFLDSLKSFWAAEKLPYSLESFQAIQTITDSPIFFKLQSYGFLKVCRGSGQSGKFIDSLDILDYLWTISKDFEINIYCL